MKVLVAIKRVMDYACPLRVKADHSGIDTTNVKYILNPFDEIAVEEAIRLKEKNIASEIVLVTIGNDACQEILRIGLAMGADRGLLIKTEETLSPLTIAKTLKAIVSTENPALILLGKQSIDQDHNQTGQMLAGLLNWPQATFVSKIEVTQDNLTVEREIDGGSETLKLRLPTVITTDLRLNHPRYLSLPNILQAKRKLINVIPFASLNIAITPKLQTVKVTPPKERGAGYQVNSVPELVKILKDKKVLP